MKLKPNSRKYTLSKLLSENSLVQTWFASKNISGESCIIKTISPSKELDDDTKNSFLLKSFEGQQKIKSNKVVTAIRKTSENNKILIEYPYFDNAIWQPITPQLFWELYPNSLIQICLIVDYIHLLDLVHCDLKLDNFLLNKSTSNPKIVLIDLDFLCPNGASAKAKIFGTPKHIAPEIFENGIITCQTDNYSVSTILLDCLDYLKKSKNIHIDKSIGSDGDIDNLIEKLMMKRAESRPSVLINSLAQHKLINKVELELNQKTLLASLLVSKYWTEKNKSLKRKKGLEEFLLQKTNIFGLHDEFIADLNFLLLKKPTMFIQVFKKLVNESNITLHDQHWQFDISDRLLDTIYKQISSLSGKNIYVDYNFHNPNEFEHLLYLAKSIYNGDKNIPSLKSYLQLKKAVDQYGEMNAANKELGLSEILNALSKLAVFLGRPDKAITYLTRLLKLQQKDDNIVLDILYRLSFLEITRQRYTESDIWINQGLEIAEGFKESALYGDFLRLKAWILNQRGEHGQSKKLLVKIEKIAKTYNHNRLMTKVHHDLGMLYWSQGDYLKAEQFLLKSAKYCLKYNFKVNLSASYGNLSLLSFEQSDYIKAVKYGELALNVAGDESDFTILGNIYFTLILAQSRLNNRREATRYLESCRGSDFFKNNLLFKKKYYNCFGTAMCNLGDLQAACKAFEIGRQFVHPDYPMRSMAKTDFIQAEISLYQGKSNICIEHINMAKAVFVNLHDNASQAEAELIERLNNEIYLGKNQGSELISVLKMLIQSRCFYYGALCLFYLLLTRKSNEISSALKISGPLLSLIKSTEVPLFKAISQLVGSRNNVLRKRHFNITRLKNCYRILDSAGNKFFAFLLCEKIADYYLSSSQMKLSSTFLKHAKQIAEDLNNNRFSDAINDKLKTLENESAETFKVQKTYLGVSEILSDISDYEMAVNKLLHFVVKEAGAERGALLLASLDNPKKLQIKSSINCDKASLEDIESISRSIPAHVSKNKKPLIIDDALKNKQTKQFKSILVHNIRSVICIPITVTDRNVGVLYLDHHTIPGLFDVGDILFVRSIGNFISIVLSSLQSFRDVDISRQQFKKQLEDFGLKNKIIYRSKVMSELLNKLPDIAKSNASVLIMGESGTGKELICDMIHKLSLRSKAPLIRLNSAAIASSLIESELFGVGKKVATGVEPREGKFSAADGGTLFLDEIGDMPIEIQAKVLRVVEDQTFEKVGSNKTISTDIRFVYATNKDLKKLIEEDKFRVDLYHRINTIEIVVPPLRHRPDDIPEISNHFFEKFMPDEQNRPNFSEGAMFCLLSYKWPGNIRELRNLIERFCILYKGQEIRIENLPLAIANSAGANSELILKARISELLQKYDWNQTKVAKVLEIPLSTLQRKIKKFNLRKDNK